MKNTLIAIAAFTAATIASATESFQVEVSGSGRPIIFIPGLSCNGSVWDETVENYQDRFECHVLSLAGFGGTTASLNNGELFLETVRDELISYIHDNELERPVIVGHSLGGFLALQVAIEDGNLASDLVIVDSLPFLPAAMNPNATAENMKASAESSRQATQQGGMSRDQARFMLATMITGEENIERGLDMSLASDSRAVAQAMYELNTIDLREKVSQIETPTHVLGAWIAYQQYGSTRESTAAIFNNQYANHPHYSLKMSDKGRHFIMLDDPDFFYAELDSILNK